MANKFAHYRGQRYKVMKEDDNYVTLEGYGYQKKHLKDEVIFENMPEDDLVPGVEDTTEIQDPLDAQAYPDLPKDRKELDLIQSVQSQQEGTLRGTEIVDDLEDQDPSWAEKERKEKADKEMNIAHTQVLKPISNQLMGVGESATIPVDPSPATVQTTSVHPTTDNPSYPKIGIDTSIFGADDRHAENEKRRKDSLAMFKEKLQGILKEIDDMDLSEMVDNLPAGSAMPANDNDAPLQSNLGGPISPVVAEDSAGSGSAGGGVATGAAAGPGTTTAGIANFDAPLGVDPKKHTLEEDSAASGTQGGTVATGAAAGPSTSTAAVANFDAPIGVGVQKRPLNETK